MVRYVVQMLANVHSAQFIGYSFVSYMFELHAYLLKLFISGNTFNANLSSKLSSELPRTAISVSYECEM